MAKNTPTRICDYATLATAFIYVALFFPAAYNYLYTLTRMVPLSIMPWWIFIMIGCLPLLTWLFSTSASNGINKFKYLLFKVMCFLSSLSVLFALTQYIFLKLGRKILLIKISQQDLAKISDFNIARPELDIIILFRFVVHFIPISIFCYLLYYIAKNIYKLDTRFSINNFSLVESLSDLKGGHADKADIVLCRNIKTNLPVIVKENDRTLHTLVCGSTGTGKTNTILINLIAQDVEKKSRYLKTLHKIINKHISDGSLLFVNPDKSTKEYLSFEDIDMMPDDFNTMMEFSKQQLVRLQATTDSFFEKYSASIDNYRNMIERERQKKREEYNLQLEKAWSSRDVDLYNSLSSLLKDVPETTQNRLFIANSYNFSPLAIYSQSKNIIYSVRDDLQKLLKSDYFIEKFELFSHIIDRLSLFKKNFKKFKINYEFEVPECYKKMESIYNELTSLEGNLGVTVIEPKGEFVKDVVSLCKAYSVPYVSIDPMDEDCPYSFNVMVGSPSDVAEIVSTVLRSLFGKQEAFFATVQEAVCKHCVLLLKYLYGDNCDLEMLRRILRSTTKLQEEVTKLRRLAIAKGNDYHMLDIVEYFEDELLGARKDKIQEFTIGLRMQLDNILANDFLRNVLVPTEGKKIFNPDRHLKYGGFIAINTSLGKFGNSSTAFGQLIAMNIEYATFRRKSDNSEIFHAIYIDELPEYLNPAFKRFLTLGRSYRIACIFSIQNLEQLIIDNSKVFLDIVKENTATKIVFGRVNPNDGKYFAMLAGQEDVPEVRESYTETASIMQPHPSSSSSTTVNYRKKDKYTYYDIMRLPLKHVFYVTVKNGSYTNPGIGLVDFIDKNKFLEKVKNAIFAKPFYAEVFKDNLDSSITEKDEEDYFLLVGDIPENVDLSSNTEDKLESDIKNDEERSSDDMKAENDFKFYEDDF